MDKNLSIHVWMAVLVLIFIGVYWTISNACTFVGIVRDPSTPFITEDYEDFMAHLAATASQSHTNAGWSVTGYGYNPVVITYGPDRHNQNSSPYSESQPSPEYESAYRTAMAAPGLSYATTMVIAHARESWNHPDAPNPHPFVYQFRHFPVEDRWLYYYELFGKPYSFMHNGKVSVQGLADQTAVGFCALDVFNDRQWAAWTQYPQLAIDTEHYSMMIMKYLMVQENYYWEGPSGPSNIPPTPPGGDAVESIEEWAIRKAAQDLDISTTFPSINGIFTDGSTMWAIAKSNSSAPHIVYYYSGEPDGLGKIASATAPGLDV
jgi:hypothetical protein